MKCVRRSYAMNEFAIRFMYSVLREVFCRHYHVASLRFSQSAIDLMTPKGQIEVLLLLLLLHNSMLKTVAYCVFAGSKGIEFHLHANKKNKQMLRSNNLCLFIFSFFFFFVLLSITHISVFAKRT